MGELHFLIMLLVVLGYREPNRFKLLLAEYTTMSGILTVKEQFNNHLEIT
jgi:hypothetical protein